MNDTEWRFANRESIDWFIEVDELDPRGQCGPIYRPMNKIENDYPHIVPQLHNRLKTNNL